MGHWQDRPLKGLEVLQVGGTNPVGTPQSLEPGWPSLGSSWEGVLWVLGAGRGPIVGEEKSVLCSWEWLTRVSCGPLYLDCEIRHLEKTKVHRITSLTFFPQQITSLKHLHLIYTFALNLNKANVAAYTHLLQSCLHCSFLSIKKEELKSRCQKR